MKRRTDGVTDEHELELIRAASELTEREQRFCEEYERDLNGTQAAIRAGYKAGTNGKSAAVAASRLLARDSVRRYRIARAACMADRAMVSAETLTMRMMDLYLRAMQATPVMEYDAAAKEYKPTGEYQFDGRTAADALEMLGKSIGLFDPTLRQDISQGIEQWLAERREGGEEQTF